MQLSYHPLRARLMRYDRLIENLHKAFPQDTLVNAVWASVASAQAKIKRGNPQKALELLEVARPYELGWQAVFMPIYVRGEAYLRLRKGAEAVVEFQKILDHRGVGSTSEFYPLAQLGTARAYRLTGDRIWSLRAYEQLFKTWKEADEDLPLLRSARAEYADVQRQSP